MTPSVDIGRRVHTATPATVRDVNRSIVLNLIRRYQPISRARLASITGIYRSSISEIVDELIGQKLLVEKLSSPSGRGRVPIQLALNPDGCRVLGISVRPFQCFVATAGLNGKLEASLSFRTPKKPAALMRELVRAVERLKAADPRAAVAGFERIGVSMPGLVDAASGVISMLPSLPEYSGFEIAAEVQRHFGAPTLVDNDSNVGALGEMWLNPAEVAELRDFILLEIGDVGVGCGIVVGGTLWRGHDSIWSGEFGHMVIDPGGPPCRCGRRGCWEKYVCDEATWRRYAPDRAYTPEDFEELIRSVSEQKEARAIRAVRETAEYLSLGISNIVYGVNPQTVLLCGEIARIWTLIEEIVRTRWASPAVPLRVRPALMPLDRLSLQGSVALALSKNFVSPELG